MEKFKNIRFVIGFCFTAFAMVLIINACHKKEEATSVNPCLGQQQTSAAFHLYEHPQDPSSTSHYWTDEPTDTMYRNRYFKLMPDYIPPVNVAANFTYTWIINGRKMLFSGQPFIAQDTFANNPSGTFTVTLIVHNTNPNKSCFPNDKGVDSTTKVINTLTPGKEGIAYGKYQGALTDNPQDTFTVSFLNKYYVTSVCDTVLWVSNLYRGCDAYIPCSYTTGAYRCLDFSTTYSVACQEMTGFLYVDEKKNATIKFGYYVPIGSSTPIVKTFVGKQLWRQY